MPPAANCAARQAVRGNESPDTKNEDIALRARPDEVVCELRTTKGRTHWRATLRSGLTDRVCIRRCHGIGLDPDEGDRLWRDEDPLGRHVRFLLRLIPKCEWNVIERCESE